MFVTNKTNIPCGYRKISSDIYQITKIIEMDSANRVRQVTLIGADMGTNIFYLTKIIS